jgi:DHA2 family multidrug resistance protein
VIWELHEKHPIVDLSLFKSRNFALGTLALCLAYAVFFGSNLLQPLWLQTRMGYIATWAGLVAAPSGVVAVILTPFAAKLMQKIDARWVATFAMLAFAASFYMRSGFTPDADFKSLVWPMLMQGVAMSTFFLSMITISLNGVPPHQLPSASGLSNFSRITAGSFAASLTTTIWERSESLHQTRLAETMASDDPTWLQAIEHLQAVGLSHAQAVGAVTNQVVNQAYLLATVDFFRASAWLTVLLIPCIWLTNKAMSGGGAPPPAD